MPAIADKTIIGAAAGGIQSAATYDWLEPLLLSAGFKIIRYMADHGDVNDREVIMRWPTIDGDSNSLADALFISNRSGGTTLYVHNLYDWDIQQSIALTYSTIQGSQGAWTGGTWPTIGDPLILAVGGGASTAFSLAFNGVQVDPMRVIISEYGIAFEQNISGSANLVVLERACWNPQRHVREMEVVGVATGSTPGWPITFAAPSGAQHLTVNIEGVSTNVTFPTAVALSAFRVAQHITMTLGGWGEAYVRTPTAGNDQIVIRIPPERAPSGNVSTTEPQISLTYQDPQMLTDGLSFEIFNGTVTAIVTGANGTIRRTGSQWPVDSGGVHIGATVYNHTRSNSALVTGFATGVTQDDTLVCDTIPGAWILADTIEVLPGPNNHQHGCGQHGGHHQCFLDSDPLGQILAGADRTVVLSDELGEAQGHYEVGQKVTITNNGFARELALSGITGTFERGEIVEVTAGTSDGTRGVIRAIVGSDIIVDCIRGPADVGYLAVPWTGGDTITGQTSGATAAIGITASPAGEGWFQFVRILAVSQKDPANGDYRTTLTLDLDEPTINGSSKFMPGACIGLAPKERFSLDFALPGSGTTGGHLPIVENSSVIGTDWDLNRNETGLAGGNRAVHEPDYETHSLQIAGIGKTLTAIALMGAEFGGTWAHLKSVNARQLFGALANTDQFAEDGDIGRLWALVAKTSTGVTGAYSQDSVTHHYMIGPANSAII